MVLQNEKSSRKGSTPPNGNVRSVGSAGGECSIHGVPENASDDSAMSTSSSPTSSASASSSTSSSLSSASAAGGGGGGSSGTSNGGERVSHEQPVIKRQRIENESTTSATSGGSSSGGPTGGAGGIGASKDGTSASCSSSVASSASSSSISLASSPSSSSTKLVSDPSSSDEELQQMKQVTDYQMVFQEAIAKQCLCGLDRHVLLKSFQAYHTNSSRSGSGNDSTKVSIGSIIGRERKKAPTRQLHPLIDWPFEYLLKFLSNVQLLFDTYLKQNIKGNICSGVMDLCNYLIRSEHQRPETKLVSMNIDEIIGLCNYNNKFITYLAGRILSSFLIIIKDDPDDRWLEKIVANLFDFSQLDLLAVRKISFSLDIIKRIVEWKDETEHPLEDETTARSLQQPQPSQAIPTGVVHHQPLHSFAGSHGSAAGSYGGGSASTSAQGASMFMVPPLEDNYFVTQYSSHQYAGDPASVIFNTAPSSKTTSGTAPASGSTDGESSGASSPIVGGGVHSSHGTTVSSFGHSATASCRYITLTDSESFDTTRIKFETISILGNKWTALVKHINQLIRAQAGTATQQNGHSMSVIATETCILTFLRLWESIISVKANLSVVETQPFHSQLDSFQLLLLSTRSSVIYKEMLTLFNEALCYGSTLALQDLIPEEVGSLAHNIVRSVKDYRILDKMPKSTYSNHMGFLGYKGDIVRYQDKRLARQGETCSSYDRNDDGSADTVDATAVVNSSNPYASGSNGGDSGMVVPPPQHQFHSPQSETCYDRTLMQKMALLVLKAVAVIVKEIRCDSSDSSVDSSEFDMQEIQMIERSIRDVVKKLETFLKIQLEFHPDSHFSKVLIHLFDDQDDYLVEAMVCTLDVTSGISFRNNAFPELIAMLNPVYTFIEFSNLGPNITHLFLDLLISPETCFLLFLLRFLKYIRQNWSMFTQSCLNYYQHNSYSNASTLLQNIRNSNIIINASASSGSNNNIILDSVMTVLISLRLQISRLVADTLFPYNITPILRLIENCESLYEGNELS